MASSEEIKTKGSNSMPIGGAHTRRLTIERFKRGNEKTKTKAKTKTKTGTN